MRRNISQLRAISYAQRDRRIERMKRAGVYADFEKSRYKYPANYLRSIGRMDLY